MDQKYVFGYWVAKQSPSSIYAFINTRMFEGMSTEKKKYRLIPIACKPHGGDQIGGYPMQNAQTTLAEAVSPLVQPIFIGVRTGRIDSRKFTPEEKKYFMQGFLTYFKEFFHKCYDKDTDIIVDDAFYRLEYNL